MKLTQLLYGSLKAKTDEEFYFLGLNAFLEGNLTEAKDFFVACAKINTDHAESYFQLARVLEKLGQKSHAIKILQDLGFRSKLEPVFKEQILQKTLDLYLTQQMGEDALKLFASHWPKTKDMDLLKKKLSAFKMTLNWDDAVELGVTLFKANELQSIELAYLETQRALGKESPEQELKDLYRILRTEPNCSVAWFRALELNRAASNHSALIEDWKNWFRHCPKAALEHTHQFEDDLFEANQYQEALHLYQETFHKFSTPPASLIHALVRSYAKIGAHDAIHEIFEKLIPMAEADPKHLLQTLLQVYVEYEKESSSSAAIRQALLNLFKENIQINVESRE